ncbi:7TM chemoreceptor [Ancylostoma ceylanicum]|uniref:7TM chemoreceptor n=2 Tax=Ancylostoma ceylanicum TaxID=53326 RepID=A0A0D6M813_9BILA|nr:7TM chemoreceptor [Ancylostoma ceylanicum]EYC08371.1 hypothetical protein Y032_0066g3727 [Ancylostoma ceylanicum]
MATVMNDMLSTTTYIISSLALLNSFALVAIYFCCPLRNVNSYRYFFILASVQDIAFSIALILTVPRVVSQKYYFIFISTGCVDQYPYGYIPLLLFCVSFFTSLLLVTNSFIYRYLQVCRTQLFNIYSSSKNRAIAIVINSLLVANYVLVIYIGFWPNEYFTDLVHGTIVVPGFDIVGRTFIGFSMQYSMNAVNLILILDTLTVMVLLECIHFFCARRIDSCLRRSALSKKSQNLQRQMFILLLLQAACPAIFLHIPCAAATLFLFTGLTTTPATTNGIGVLLALYPFFNPLIIIAFVRDYRNFVLTKLRLRKATKQVNSSVVHNNVFVSEVRNVTPQHYVVTGSNGDMN